MIGLLDLSGWKLAMILISKKKKKKKGRDVVM